jgi:hypothetical protein
MRMRSRLALVMAIAMLAVAVGAVTASADVERCQSTSDTYLLLADGRNYHEYTVDATNPCDGAYSATGMFMGTDPMNLAARGVLWHQVLSDWFDDDTTISFHSDYPYSSTGYWFEFTGTTTDGVLWDGTGIQANGDWPATLTLTDSSTTDYKNHGQYVKDAEDKKAAAHSLAGMPVQSQKKNK